MQVPDKAEEPTSTIVLTSKTSHYVDVRIYKSAPEGGLKILSAGQSEILEWAFAGESHTNKEGTNSDTKKPYHAVWDHWIDSKSSDPSADEGDMLPQPNGDVLEQGSQIHPVTGLQCEYEELWGELDVETVGGEADRISIVLKVENDDNKTRGMVVRVGSWCQGILKTGDNITVERWQAQDPKSGKWNQIIKLGSAILPCERTFSVEGLENGNLITSNDLQWKIIEKHGW